MDRQPYLVIGTAGHIDHGKTSLIRRLTGVDLDTLPEEQERKITIALGFTHLPLPSGRVAAFVDVPGHERLVRTMVAGASGIDAVLLCVSAVEGVMPQTTEHLAILQLLGVEQGLVALTFADQVDEELLELAEEEARDTLEGTALAAAPILPVSSVTGQGVPAILSALDALESGDRRVEGGFRLPVDRVFSRHGHGTVVTGTVAAGQLALGDEVDVVPGSPRVRVRGIQVHGETVSSTQAGLRTALNLNVSRGELERGHQVISPGAVPSTRVVEVAYSHLAGAPVIEDLSEVRFLCGTAEVVATARPLGAERVPPEAEGWTGGDWQGFMQLLLAKPVGCLPQDRFVLRRASPVETLGGGRVLDPWCRPVRHRERGSRAAQAARLAAGERDVLLERAGLNGLSLDDARLRGCLPGDCSSADRDAWGRVVGDRAIHALHLRRLWDTVRQVLGRYHAQAPLSPGAHRKELVAGPLHALGDRALEALLQQMLEAGELARAAGRYRLAEHSLQLDEAQQAACARLEAAALRPGLALEPLHALVAEGAHPDAEALLHHLVDRGRLVRVGPFIGHRRALDDLTAQVKSWLRSEGSFTPGQAKERLGLTRKHLIPLLEWLDAQRVTRRVGGARAAFL